MFLLAGWGMAVVISWVLCRRALRRRAQWVDASDKALDDEYERLCSTDKTRRLAGSEWDPAAFARLRAAVEDYVSLVFRDCGHERRECNGDCEQT